MSVCLSVSTWFVFDDAHQVEAEDFSQQLFRNVNMASANPLYERRGKETYVSVLQGQLRYNSASREVASAKYTYVVRWTSILDRGRCCRHLL